MRIEFAAASREWMDATPMGFANRCLPLRIANQAGWFILNDQKIEVMWNGGQQLEDLTIRYGPAPGDGSRTPSAVSHFGSGIITWKMPFLLWTAPGHNLYVRGPSNWFKDGAAPLDGIVETDWSVMTFTMNWKITRRGATIIFEEGKPICMIFPVPRGYLEAFQPGIQSFAGSTELKDKVKGWVRRRQDFSRVLQTPEGKPSMWQKHYFQGRLPDDHK